jgi:hypothetical protein
VELSKDFFTYLARLMLYLIGGALLLALAAARDVYLKRNSGLPPGPPGLPLLGNVLELPSTFLWYRLTAWSKSYGPVFTIWVFGTPMVILSSVAAAADVLDRMSGATAGRPVTVKVCDFICVPLFHSQCL